MWLITKNPNPNPKSDSDKKDFNPNSDKKDNIKDSEETLNVTVSLVEVGMYSQKTLHSWEMFNETGNSDVDVKSVVYDVEDKLTFWIEGSSIYV